MVCLGLREKERKERKVKGEEEKERESVRERDREVTDLLTFIISPHAHHTVFLRE